jgi:hypothetical protein
MLVVDMSKHRKWVRTYGGKLTSKVFAEAVRNHLMQEVIIEVTRDVNRSQTLRRFRVNSIKYSRADMTVNLRLRGVRVRIRSGTQEL